MFLNDGRWLARVSGFARFLRIKTVPLALSFPLGITPAGILALPLPSKVTVRVLPRCGHMPMIERPGDTLFHLERFLQRPP